MHYHRIDSIDGFNCSYTHKEVYEQLCSHESSGPDYVRDILSRLTDEFEEQWCDPFADDFDEADFIDPTDFMNNEVPNLGIF